MKTSGISRRIDELGRIVIPSDIREHFKIKAGDNFQISIDDNKIVLTKFSPIEKELSSLYSMCEVLESTIDAKVMFYYDNVFIDPNKDESSEEDQTITTAFEELLSEYVPSSFNDVQMFKEDNETVAGYTYPIIKEGNILGVFIIFKQLAKLSDKMLDSIVLIEQLLLKVI